jgi:dihydrofolate reductase
MPYFDQEFGEELDRLFSEKFDLLLGRKTYEIFAAYWPYYDEDAPHGGIAKLFNGVKKYVVSRSGEVDTSWAGSVLLRDIADVKRLKQEDGPNLVTQGRTELVHALLANDLVDAMSLFTVPVVLGGGKKLFGDGSAPHSFKLTRSRVAPKGLIVGHYEREGEIKIGGTALDSPSGISPSSVMASAVKKAIAAPRSSTTTLTWSNLLIVMSLVIAEAVRGGPGRPFSRVGRG